MTLTPSGLFFVPALNPKTTDGIDHKSSLKKGITTNPRNPRRDRTFSVSSSSSPGPSPSPPAVEFSCHSIETFVREWRSFGQLHPEVGANPRSPVLRSLLRTFLERALKQMQHAPGFQSVSCGPGWRFWR